MLHACKALQGGSKKWRPNIGRMPGALVLARRPRLLYARKALQGGSNDSGKEGSKMCVHAWGFGVGEVVGLEQPGVVAGVVAVG